MDSSPSQPTARELIDAFVHAPTLLPIGERIEGDRIVVLSHVEVWPWRVVVRALVANPHFTPQPMRFPNGDMDASTAVGVVTAEVAASTGHQRERWQRDIEWMNAWTLADDTGTQFRSSGWSGRPSDDQLWCDLALTYDMVVPPIAQRLVISGPAIGQIDVALPK
jgi:hypothetical protein